MRFLSSVRLVLAFSVLPASALVAQSESSDFKSFNDSLFYTYRERLDQALNGQDSSKIRRAHFNLAQFYKERQIYTEAVAHYNRALTSSSTTTSDKLQIAIKNSLGAIFLALNEYHNAQHYLQESLSASQKIGDTLGEAKSLELLGTSWEKLRKPQLALEFQSKSLLLYKELDDLNGQASVYENIGSVYEDLQEFEKAQTYFEKAYTFFKHLDDERQLNALNNLSDIYRKTGFYQEAIAKTTEVLELAKSCNNPHQIASAYKDLAKVYALVEDFKQAYTYALAYQDLVRSQFYSQNISQLHALQIIYDTKEKQARIELLEQERETSRVKWIAMLLLLLILISGGIVLFYIQRKKRQAKLAVQRYKQLALEAELETKAAREQNLQNEIELKTATLSKYSLSIAQKNKLIEQVSATLQKISLRKRIDVSSKLIELSHELDVHLKADDAWSQFMVLFDDIHPQFTQKLREKALENLSATEIRLALLLRLNLSSKEIASILRITPDSVRVARYRLRKKLPVARQEDLVEFMLKL